MADPYADAGAILGEALANRDTSAHQWSPLRVDRLMRRAGCGASCSITTTREKNGWVLTVLHNDQVVAEITEEVYDEVMAPPQNGAWLADEISARVNLLHRAEVSRRRETGG